MLKKKLSLLALVVLTLCLLDFAFDRLAPSSPVAQAANDTHAALLSAGPGEKPALPLTRAAQPVAALATGLVCVVFGVIAVSPLLLGDPEQSLQEANRAD